MNSKDLGKAHWSGVRRPVASTILAIAAFLPLSPEAAPPLREYGAPTRIASMAEGLVVVSDFSEGMVHVVRRSDLAVVKTIDVDGQPVAVAWSRGRIYVGNETKGQVEAYNIGGQRVATYGVPGSIRLPNSIVVLEASDRLLVLDAYEKAIKAFTLDGVFLGTLTGPGAIGNPSAMSFDAGRQLLLVSDFGEFSSNMFRRAQARIRVLDLAGTETARIALKLSRPQGTAVDGRGHLFVVDSFLSRVHVLDASSGVELGIIGGLGGEAGQLDLPLDVHYSAMDDSILVTDSRNGRIAVFPLGVAP